MTTISFMGACYEARDDETILEALLRQGARLPSCCREGSCHACTLKCDAGTVEHRRAIDPALVHEQHILPCIAHARSDLALDAPDPAWRAITAELVSRREVGGGVYELGIAPMKELDYDAGQHVLLIREDGLSRPYSLTSLPGLDYFFTIDASLHDAGAMSRWLCLEAPIGQAIHMLPPRGDCHWRPGMRAASRLVMLATGSGAGALAAIARQALAVGYQGEIMLYHGSNASSGLYLDGPLRELSDAHPNFRYIPCVSDEPAAGARAGRVTTSAFADLRDLADAHVFLCGSPAMVDEARSLAMLADAQRDRIHVVPFDAAEPMLPHDGEMVAGIRPDPAP